ncbi:MAG TPA: ACP S-malonyltransferase [Clostridia bacterium]|nr:ACP S-malonyltransferase [Clostridia bacterium]
MKIGFLFPGQGSQSIGMGKDLYEKYEEVKNIYKKVKDITGIDIAEITFNGKEEELNETKITQLAVLTMSLSIIEVLKREGVSSEVVAGLSLGEYTALIYSGVLSFEQGVSLVKKRGEFMQSLSPKGEWAMCAIIGLEDEKIDEICKTIEDGFVVPANYNCLGQLAISGEKDAVEKAAEKAKEAGAKKTITLKVLGPFHTEKLVDSSNALRKELENIQINSFKASVIKNIDGMPYLETDDIKDILANHIIKPVRFSKTLQTMLDMGVDTFIEIGSGRVLSGFAKRLNSENKINVLNINNVETLENTLNFLKKEGN